MSPNEALAKIREIVAQVDDSDREELFENLAAYVDDNVIDSFEEDDEDDLLEDEGDFDFDLDDDE